MRKTIISKVAGFAGGLPASVLGAGADGCDRSHQTPTSQPSGYATTTAPVQTVREDDPKTWPAHIDPNWGAVKSYWGEGEVEHLVGDVRLRGFYDDGGQYGEGHWRFLYARTLDGQVLPLNSSTQPSGARLEQYKALEREFSEVNGYDLNRRVYEAIDSLRNKGR